MFINKQACTPSPTDVVSKPVLDGFVSRQPTVGNYLPHYVVSSQRIRHSQLLRPYVRAQFQTGDATLGTGSSIMHKDQLMTNANTFDSGSSSTVHPRQPANLANNSINASDSSINHILEALLLVTQSTKLSTETAVPALELEHATIRVEQTQEAFTLSMELLQALPQCQDAYKPASHVIKVMLALYQLHRQLVNGLQAIGSSTDEWAHLFQAGLSLYALKAPRRVCNFNNSQLDSMLYALADQDAVTYCTTLLHRINAALPQLSTVHDLYSIANLAEQLASDTPGDLLHQYVGSSYLSVRTSTINNLANSILSAFMSAASQLCSCPMQSLAARELLDIVIAYNWRRRSSATATSGHLPCFVPNQLWLSQVAIAAVYGTERVQPQQLTKLIKDLQHLSASRAGPTQAEGIIDQQAKMAIQSVVLRDAAYWQPHDTAEVLIQLTGVCPEPPSPALSNLILDTLLALGNTPTQRHVLYTLLQQAACWRQQTSLSMSEHKGLLEALFAMLMQCLVLETPLHFNFFGGSHRASATPSSSSTTVTGHTNSSSIGVASPTGSAHGGKHCTSSGSTNATANCSSVSSHNNTFTTEISHLSTPQSGRTNGSSSSSTSNTAVQHSSMATSLSSSSNSSLSTTSNPTAFMPTTTSSATGTQSNTASNSLWHNSNFIFEQYPRLIQTAQLLNYRPLLLTSSMYAEHLQRHLLTCSSHELVNLGPEGLERVTKAVSNNISQTLEPSLVYALEKACCTLMDVFTTASTPTHPARWIPLLSACADLAVPMPLLASAARFMAVRLFDGSKHAACMWQLLPVLGKLECSSGLCYEPLHMAIPALSRHVSRAASAVQQAQPHEVHSSPSGTSSAQQGTQLLGALPSLHTQNPAMSHLVSAQHDTLAHGSPHPSLAPRSVIALPNNHSDANNHHGVKTAMAKAAQRRRIAAQRLAMYTASSIRKYDVGDEYEQWLIEIGQQLAESLSRMGAAERNRHLAQLGVAVP